MRKTLSTIVAVIACVSFCPTLCFADEYVRDDGTFAWGDPDNSFSVSLSGPTTAQTGAAIPVVVGLRVSRPAPAVALPYFVWQAQDQAGHSIPRRTDYILGYTFGPGDGELDLEPGIVYRQYNDLSEVFKFSSGTYFVTISWPVILQRDLETIPNDVPKPKVARPKSRTMEITIGKA